MRGASLPVVAMFQAYQKRLMSVSAITRPFLTGTTATVIIARSAIIPRPRPALHRRLRRGPFLGRLKYRPVRDRSTAVSFTSLGICLFQSLTKLPQRVHNPVPTLMRDFDQLGKPVGIAAIWSESITYDPQDSALQVYRGSLYLNHSLGITLFKLFAIICDVLIEFSFDLEECGFDAVVQHIGRRGSMDYRLVGIDRFDDGSGIAIS